MVRSMRACVLRAALGCGRMVWACVALRGSVASTCCRPPRVVRSEAMASTPRLASLSGCCPLRTIGAYTLEP